MNTVFILLALALVALPVLVTTAFMAYFMYVISSDIQERRNDWDEPIYEFELTDDTEETYH